MVMMCRTLDLNIFIHGKRYRDDGADLMLAFTPLPQESYFII